MLFLSDPAALNGRSAPAKAWRLTVYLQPKDFSAPPSAMVGFRALSLLDRLSDSLNELADIEGFFNGTEKAFFQYAAGIKIIT